MIKPPGGETNGSGNNRKHVTNNIFLETNVAFQVGGGGRGHGYVQKNILTFAVLLDDVGHLATTPNIDLVDTAAGITDPAFYLFESTVKSSLIQVGLENTN